jgi:hypothetical protein
MVAWAKRVPIGGSRQVGECRCRWVLISLADHADGSGDDAFPGAQSIADEWHGLDRRDVRNAFDVLEKEGLISRDGKVGRAVRWRLNVAGYPATSAAPNVAGHVAGEVAGHPAPKEVKNSLARTRPRARPPKPPWCGHCNETTRQTEDDNGTPRRCPTCHPLRKAQP